MTLAADLAQLVPEPEPVRRFRGCGHPMSEENTRHCVVRYFSRKTNATKEYRYVRCRQCHNDQKRLRWWRDQALA